MRLSLIAALARDRGIGNNGNLLWRIPDDLKRFKTLTTGHPVIMGRKTWESIPEKYRPLPDRTNIVVSRQPKYRAPGALVASSLGLAIALSAPETEEAFVAGGAEVYCAALPHADRLYLTEIDDVQTADTFFPEYSSVFSKIISLEERDWNGLRYRWVDLERA